MRITFWGRHSRIGIIAAAFAFAIDQAHKWWMLYALGIAERRVMEITPFLDLVLVWNRGVSYGWLQQDTVSGTYLLIGFTLLAVVCMIVWLATCDSARTALALGLIIGGALGNGADRLIYGAVADFFSFHAFGFYWYIFNLADVAIVVGVAILLYESVWANRRADKANGSPG